MNIFSKKNGLLAGVFVVLFFALFYVIDKTTMLGMVVYWSSLIIYIGFMAKACLEERGSHGDLLTFKDALRTAFVTFLLANLFFHIFNYILFKFIDPGLIETQMEMAKKVYAQFLDEAQSKKMIKEMAKNRFEMSITNVIFEYAKGAIGGFILSLIVAGLVKRDPI